MTWNEYVNIYKHLKILETDPNQLNSVKALMREEFSTVTVGTDELNRILDEMDASPGIHSVNIALAKLRSWGDRNRVWLGTFCDD